METKNIIFYFKKFIQLHQGLIIKEKVSIKTQITATIRQGHTA
jgi:hypothetical protein